MQMHSVLSLRRGSGALAAAVITAAAAPCGAQVEVFCGGGAPPGRVQVGTPWTDNAGNKFTLFCVNGTYFEGEIMHGGMTYPFGRCVFVGGANKFIFTRNAGTWTRMVWVNVKPDPPTNARRDEILIELCPLAGESPADQEARIRMLISNGSLNANIYSIGFSPGDQDVQRFTQGLLSSSLTLTPAQAPSAYSSLTSPPELAPEPSMLSPPFPIMQSADIPAPSALWLGVVGLACVRRRR